jgi:hypothetical protein
VSQHTHIESEEFRYVVVRNKLLERELHTVCEQPYDIFFAVTLVVRLTFDLH